MTTTNFYMVTTVSPYFPAGKGIPQLRNGGVLLANFSSSTGVCDYFAHYSDSSNRYLRLAGKAHGVKGVLRPKYMLISESPEVYIHPDYLPPKHARRKGFLILKPSAMHADDLILWIKHLLKRQALIALGELDGDVFAFRTVHLSLDDELRSERKNRKGKKRMSKTQSVGESEEEEDDGDGDDDDDDDEIEIDEALKTVERSEENHTNNSSRSDRDGPSENDIAQDEDERSSDDSSDEDSGEEETTTRDNSSIAGKKTSSSPPFDTDSPASIRDNWTSRLEFVRSLSKLREFQELANILPDEAVGPILVHRHLAYFLLPGCPGSIT